MASCSSPSREELTWGHRGPPVRGVVAVVEEQLLVADGEGGAPAAAEAPVAEVGGAARPAAAARGAASRAGSVLDDGRGLVTQGQGGPSLHSALP